MEFETVFDVEQAPYNWYYAAFGLCFVVFATVWSFCVRHAESRRTRYPPRFMLGFTMVWTGAVFGTTFSEWYGGRQALADGRASVVEGVVEDFVPMPYEGHQEERFTVRGVTFCYSDYTMTSLFHNTRSHGGPIQAGLYVRVHYVGSDILKLEIRE